MNRRNLLLAILLVALLVVSCAKTPGTDAPAPAQTPVVETPSEQTVSEAPPTLDMEGRNEYGVRNVPPEGLPENWDSMQFSIGSDIQDWFGKPLSQIGGDYIFTAGENVKTVPPGVRMDVGLTTQEYRESSGGYFNLMELSVLNPSRDKEVNIEDAIVVSVQADSTLLMIMPEDLSTFGENTYIFPKGLTIYDTVERMKELYGEPDVVEEGDFEKKYAYISGDKSLSIFVYSDTISSFLLQSFEEPEYVVAAHQGSKDFSKELNEESFFNIGGYHLHFYTPLREVKEALQLVHAPINSEDNTDSDQVTLAPGEEITYVGTPRGFDNLAVAVRIHNLTDESINVQDGVVTGMRVQLLRKNYSLMEDHLFRIPFSSQPPPKLYAEYTMPAITPLGIVLGGDVEESLKVIPDDPLEKELLDDGGGYATYDANGVRYLVMGRAHEKGNVIDELTMILFLDDIQ